MSTIPTCGIDTKTGRRDYFGRQEEGFLRIFLLVSKDLSGWPPLGSYANGAEACRVGLRPHHPKRGITTAFFIFPA